MEGRPTADGVSRTEPRNSFRSSMSAIVRQEQSRMNPNLPPHSFAEHAPNPYAPKNPGGGTNWRTVGLLLGSILLVSIAVCSGVAYLGVRGISNRPPTAAEKQTLVTASDLKSFGAMPQKLGQREVWNVKKNIDGSVEMEYDYDP